VQAVMAEVARAEAQKRARQNRMMWLTVGGAALVLLVLGVLAASVMMGGPLAPAGPTDAPGASGGASAQPTATASQFLDPAGLPAPLQTLIPPGVRLLNPPTPSVKKGEGAGAPASTCPRSAGEAAELFGGGADQWQYESSSGGWIMVSTSGAVTIRVPANMTAGYMTIGSELKITQVNGPATLENVYMVALSCE
jgi:hypothetical protein